MAVNKITDFVRSTDYDSMSNELTKFVKLSILDCVGSTLESADILDNTYQPIYINKRPFSKAESHVIGSRSRVTAEDAFRANCHSTSVYEQDGMPAPAPACPGRQVILATLATAEKLNASMHDVIAATTIIYELFLRTGQSVAEIGWPPDATYPSDKLSHYCFTVPGIANIAYCLAFPQSEAEMEMASGINLSGTYEPENGTSSSNGAYDPKQEVRLRLIKETFLLLQNTSEGGFMQIRVYSTKTVDEIVKQIANSKELAYRLGQKYMLMQQGFKPPVINRRLQPALAAVKMALGNKPDKLNSIKQIIFKGTSLVFRLWTDCSIDDARYIMALATAFLSGGVDPEVPLVMNSKLERANLAPLWAKIEYEEDGQAWLDCLDEKDFTFSASVLFNDGSRSEASMKGNISERVNRSTEKQLSRDFKDRVNLIGEKRGQDLLAMLVSTGNYSVKEMMRLTGPTLRYKLKVFLDGLFSRREPEDDSDA